MSLRAMATGVLRDRGVSGQYLVGLARCSTPATPSVCAGLAPLPLLTMVINCHVKPPLTLYGRDRNHPETRNQGLPAFSRISRFFYRGFTIEGFAKRDPVPEKRPP